MNDISDMPSVGRLEKMLASVPVEAPNKRVKIIALILNRTLGEFIDQNVFAASVKALFDNAQLCVYYRNDRPYKAPIISMNPSINSGCQVKDRKSLPLDFFDIAGEPPVAHSDRRWYSAGFASPDIVLTPSVMRPAAIGTMPAKARLEVPANRRQQLDDQLEALGLDRRRWFCTIHYRESGYEFRPDRPARDHDPKVFEALANRIIDDLGGQVVRIGHPGMVPFQPRPGFVDVSPVDDGFLLQANALSRARFHLCTPSGTSTLASALGTPLAHVCDVHGDPYIWGEQDYVLCSHLITPEQKRVSVRSLHTRMFGGDRWKERMVSELGFQIVHCSVEELLAMARHMTTVTADVTGWRENPVVRKESGPRPNRLELPVTRRKHRARVVHFPDLAPRLPELDLGDDGPYFEGIEFLELGGRTPG